MTPPPAPHRPPSARRVAVFGEALVDELPSGARPGGAPLNVAAHAAAFGLSPLLLTRLGPDPAGLTLRAAMTSRGIPVEGVQSDPTFPTGRAVVTLRGGIPRFEIPAGAAFDAIDGAAAARAVREARPAVVAFGTLALREPASREALREVLDASPAVRLVDLNLRAPWYDGAVVTRALSAAHVVKASDEELDELRRLLCLTLREPEALAADVVRRFRLKALYVTRGARGAAVSWRSGDVVHRAEADAAGSHDEVVDTVGAGDAFTAVVLLGLVRHWTAEESLRRGVEFAAAVTRIAGATPEEPSFYAPFLAQWPEAS
ncbi:MAG TPA: PfkB family carbohydrate kinase [Thermoanaerobaculia bacterium]|nr:PfkB family carbohydrate kinase [Thermoanaerobaculia bacterium]